MRVFSSYIPFPFFFRLLFCLGYYHHGWDGSCTGLIDGLGALCIDGWGEGGREGTEHTVCFWALLSQQLLAVAGVKFSWLLNRFCVALAFWVSGGTGIVIGDGCHVVVTAAQHGCCRCSMHGLRLVRDEIRAEDSAYDLYCTVLNTSVMVNYRCCSPFQLSR